MAIKRTQLAIREVNKTQSEMPQLEGLRYLRKENFSMESGAALGIVHWGSSKGMFASPFVNFYNFGGKNLFTPALDKKDIFPLMENTKIES